jgi:hypothetical protein
MGKPEGVRHPVLDALVGGAARGGIVGLTAAAFLSSVILMFTRGADWSVLLYDAAIGAAGGLFIGAGIRLLGLIPAGSSDVSNPVAQAVKALDELPPAYRVEPTDGPPIDAPK